MTVSTIARPARRFSASMPIFLARAWWSPWVIFALTVVSLRSAIASNTDPWRGEFLYTQFWIESALGVIMAPCAALAALDGARWAKAGKSSLLGFAGTQRFAFGRLMGSWLVAIVLPTLVTWLYASQWMPSYRNPQAAVAVAQLLLNLASLLVMILLGFVLGQALGIVGPVVALILVFLVWRLNWDSFGAPISVGVDVDFGSMVGLTTSWRHVALQALVLVVAIAFLVVRVEQATTGKSRRGLLPAIGVALSVSLLGFAALGGQRFVTSTVPVVQDCADGPGYSACASQENSWLLPSVAKHQAALVQVGKLVGISVPTAAVELGYDAGEKRNSGVVYWSNPGDRQGAVSLSNYLNDVSWLPQCSSVSDYSSEVRQKDVTNFVAHMAPIMQAQELHDLGQGPAPTVTAQTQSSIQAAWATLARCGS